MRKSCQVSKSLGAVTRKLGFITRVLEQSSFTKSTGAKWKFSWIKLYIPDHDHSPSSSSPDFGFLCPTVRLREQPRHLIISGRGQLAASLDVMRVELHHCPTSLFIQCTHLEILPHTLSNNINLLMLDPVLNTPESVCPGYHAYTCTYVNLSTLCMWQHYFLLYCDWLWWRFMDCMHKANPDGAHGCLQVIGAWTKKYYSPSWSFCGILELKGDLYRVCRRQGITAAGCIHKINE